MLLCISCWCVSSSVTSLILFLHDTRKAKSRTPGIKKNTQITIFYAYIFFFYLRKNNVRFRRYGVSQCSHFWRRVCPCVCPCVCPYPPAAACRPEPPRGLCLRPRRRRLGGRRSSASRRLRSDTR